jgi:hypothetical protein
VAEEPSEDVDPDEVPDVLNQVVDQLGVFVPDHATAATRPIYARMLNRQCMACGSELKANTILMVSALGVVGIFCGGTCENDWQVLGYLREQHDDLLEKIELRGKGVEQHGEPGGDDTDPRATG